MYSHRNEVHQEFGKYVGYNSSRYYPVFARMRIQTPHAFAQKLFPPSNVSCMHWLCAGGKPTIQTAIAPELYLLLLKKRALCIAPSLRMRCTKQFFYATKTQRCCVAFVQMILLSQRPQLLKEFLFCRCAALGKDCRHRI